MIICCKIYLVIFYFCGLRKPRKYFYNENFQIYVNAVLGLLKEIFLGLDLTITGIYVKSTKTRKYKLSLRDVMSSLLWVCTVIFSLSI